MEYGVQYEETGGYGPYDVYKWKSLSSFRLWIATTAKVTDIDNICALACTVLPKTGYWWQYWKQRLHVMVLDVDSTANLIAATKVLKRDGIGWAGIESSPGHFWLVTDKIGQFNELFSYMEALPGVDPKYVKGTKKWKSFMLRAIARNSSKPKFGHCDDLADHRAVAFFKEFEQLHNDQIITENLGLIQHLKNGTMIGAAADPAFEI